MIIPNIRSLDPSTKSLGSIYRPAQDASQHKVYETLLGDRKSQVLNLSLPRLHGADFSNMCS